MEATVPGSKALLMYQIMSTWSRVADSALVAVDESWGREHSSVPSNEASKPVSIVSDEFNEGSNDMGGGVEHSNDVLVEAI